MWWSYTVRYTTLRPSILAELSQAVIIILVRRFSCGEFTSYDNQKHTCICDMLSCVRLSCLAYLAEISYMYTEIHREMCQCDASQGCVKLGDSRKYPYPTTGGMNVLKPPCLPKFQNALPLQIPKSLTLAPLQKLAFAS